MASRRVNQTITAVDDVLAGDPGVVDIVNCGSEDRRKHLDVCEYVLRQQRQTSLQAAVNKSSICSTCDVAQHTIFETYTSHTCEKLM